MMITENLLVLCDLRSRGRTGNLWENLRDAGWGYRQRRVAFGKTEGWQRASRRNKCPGFSLLQCHSLAKDPIFRT